MQNYEFIKVLSSSETLALLLSIFAALYAFLAMYLIYLKRTKVKNQILSKFLDKKITMSEAQFLFSEVNNDSIMHLKNLNNDLDNDAKKMNKTLNKNCCNFDGFYDFIKSVYLEERFLCNLFRGGLIAIVILFVILMLSIKEFFLIEDLNITSVVNRFLIVFPFMFLIVYLSREASRHRKSMIINRQKYVDLNVVDFYTLNLPKEKGIEIRMKLLEHFFNHKEFDYKCEPLISKEFLETLKALQKTFEFEGKNLDKVKSLKNVIKKD